MNSHCTYIWLAPIQAHSHNLLLSSRWTCLFWSSGMKSCKFSFIPSSPWSVSFYTMVSDLLDPIAHCTMQSPMWLQYWNSRVSHECRQIARESLPFQFCIHVLAMCNVQLGLETLPLYCRSHGEATQYSICLLLNLWTHGVLPLPAPCKRQWDYSLMWHYRAVPLKRGEKNQTVGLYSTAPLSTPPQTIDRVGMCGPPMAKHSPLPKPYSYVPITPRKASAAEQSKFLWKTPLQRYAGQTHAHTTHAHFKKQQKHMCM